MRLDAQCQLCILVTSAPLVAITGKKKGAHSLSVLPTEALRKPYPVTEGNAPKGAFSSQVRIVKFLRFQLDL